MEPFVELLADDVDVVTPDLPGHGSRVGEPYSLTKSVDAVAQAVAGVGERPVILAGHSLGGFAAMTYAETHSARLAGMALMGCAAEPQGPGAWAYRVAGRALDVVGPKRIDSLRSGGAFQPIAPLWDEVIDTCGSWQLRDVACPVLFLGGGLDQLQLNAQKFARTARRGIAVTRPGRSHMWPYRRPHEVARELTTWLRTVVAPWLFPAVPA